MCLYPYRSMKKSTKLITVFQFPKIFPLSIKPGVLLSSWVGPDQSVQRVSALGRSVVVVYILPADNYSTKKQGPS